jgi:hypothetical protein
MHPVIFLSFSLPSSSKRIRAAQQQQQQQQHSSSKMAGRYSIRVSKNFYIYKAGAFLKKFFSNAMLQSVAVELCIAGGAHSPATTQDRARQESELSCKRPNDLAVVSAKPLSFPWFEKCQDKWKAFGVVGQSVSKSTRMAVSGPTEPRYYYPGV